MEQVQRICAFLIGEEMFNAFIMSLILINIVLMATVHDGE